MLYTRIGLRISISYLLEPIKLTLRSFEAILAILVPRFSMLQKLYPVCPYFSCAFYFSFVVRSLA